MLEIKNKILLELSNLISSNEILNLIKESELGADLLIKDLDLDSLEVFELIMLLEEMFKIDINYDEFIDNKMLSDLVHHIENQT